MAEYSSELHGLFFPLFSRQEVELLLSLMNEVSVDEGDVLFSLGAFGDELFFVVKGRFAVQKNTGFGDRTQAVALLEPGAPVGERALLGYRRHGATLTAVKDSILLSLSRRVFEEFKQQHPFLALKLLEWLLDRTTLRLEKSSDRLSHIL